MEGERETKGPPPPGGGSDIIDLCPVARYVSNGLSLARSAPSLSTFPLARAHGV